MKTLRPNLGRQLQTSVHLLCLCREVAESCSTLLLRLVTCDSGSAQHTVLIGSLEVITSLLQLVLGARTKELHDHLQLCINVYICSICTFVSCSKGNEPQCPLEPQDSVLTQTPKDAQGIRITNSHTHTPRYPVHNYLFLSSAYNLYKTQLYMQRSTNNEVKVGGIQASHYTESDTALSYLQGIHFQTVSLE